MRPQERVLREGGQTLTLGARAFDVLSALIDRRHRVVSKAELMELGWGNLVVEDNNLSVQISAIRRVLGRDSVCTVAGRGYRFTLACESSGADPDSRSTSPSSASPSHPGIDELHPPSASKQPRIAVLPFESDGGHAERYFGDGITEEIITNLALNRHFFVISRGSTLHLRSQTKRLVDIAQELGVRYLLDGTVRRQGHRLRIGAELSDCQLGQVLWAERFEGQQDELFKLQARISSKITAAIDPCIRSVELNDVRSRPTGKLDSYDSMLKGLHLMYSEGERAFEDAGPCFERAVALDPQFAQAHANLSWWLSMRIGEGRSLQAQTDREMAQYHAYRAIELDPRDAWALAIAGHTMSFLFKRFSVALDMFEQALSINPNSAVAWARSATTLAYLGRGAEAIERVLNALDLSPFDPFAFTFCTTHGLACMVSEKYDEAVLWLDKALRLNPRYRAAARLLIAARALAGDLDGARACGASFLQREPDFKVSEFGLWYPLQSPHHERLLAALRQAGLPA
nr:winged helix-turn-helix domain-containing protein [Roseateles albus]